MDKQALKAQLITRIRESIDVAERERTAAADAARTGATANEKREDARMAIEYGSLARGQGKRAQQARLELAALESFHPAPVADGGAVGLGALVEIEDEDAVLGRTFFLAPAGAGIELTGPGGDGFLSVVTPGSPVGRAAMGCKLGESIEVTVAGETRYWCITWLE